MKTPTNERPPAAASRATQPKGSGPSEKGACLLGPTRKLKRLVFAAAQRVVPAPLCPPPNSWTNYC